MVWLCCGMVPHFCRSAKAESIEDRYEQLQRRLDFQQQQIRQLQQKRSSERLQRLPRVRPVAQATGNNGPDGQAPGADSLLSEPLAPGQVLPGEDGDEDLLQEQQAQEQMAQEQMESPDPPGQEESTDNSSAEASSSEPEASSDARAELNADLLSRLDSIEQTLGNVEKDQSDFLEEPSVGSQRITSGRLHIDQWGFPESTPGVNTIETGDPAKSPQDRLMYRRIRFGFRGTVPPANMSYRVEIEFSGQEGSQFRDAWIGWDDLVLLNTVRVGNQKRPYGLDHLNSSNFNVFMERPFVIDGFNEDNRRFGIASYGVSDDQRFNWRYGLYDMALIQDMGATITDNYPVELAGRLATTWWYDPTSGGRGYGHLGLATTFAFPDTHPPASGDQDTRARFRTHPEGRSTNQWLDTGFVRGGKSYQVLGLESVVNVGALQFVGEYMNLWMQRDAPAGSRGRGSDLYLHGGYFYLSYFLTGEHIPWNRDLGILGRVKPFEDFFHLRQRNGRTARGMGAWQVACRLSYADFNDDNIFGGVGRSATLALNWYWNAHTRLQLNYLFGRIDNRQAALASGGTTLASGGYQIAGVRVMVDF